MARGWIFELLLTGSEHLQKVVPRLVARSTYSNGRPMSVRRRERLAKYDSQVSRYGGLQGEIVEAALTNCRCGDDLKLLNRFVEAQRMAFHKILKKYKVCRYQEEVLQKECTNRTWNTRSGRVLRHSEHDLRRRYSEISRVSHDGTFQG